MGTLRNNSIAGKAMAINAAALFAAFSAIVAAAVPVNAATGNAAVATTFAAAEGKITPAPMTTANVSTATAATATTATAAAATAATAPMAATGIPQDGLVAYYPFTGGSLENFAGGSSASTSGASTSDVQDADAVSASATTAPQAAVNKGATFGPDRFGNANSAAVFSGDSNVYMEIPDHDAFSINTAGALTISVWVCPKVLTFRNAESSGYVHWMGKGVPHQHEWVLRMYNKELTASQENRPNRMSAYAFNLEGGLGSGSYVQETLTEGEWMHIVARYDIAANTITLFKNGEQKDQDALYDETYGVQVQNGTAPVRLGTRSLWSFFEGSIDDLRFYSRALTDEEIIALYNEPDPAAVPNDTAARDTSAKDTSARDTTNASTAIRAFSDSRALDYDAKKYRALENTAQRANAQKPHAMIVRASRHSNSNRNTAYRIQFLVDGKAFDTNGKFIGSSDIGSRRIEHSDINSKVVKNRDSNRN